MSSIDFSSIGEKLSARSGILDLMDDLGAAVTLRPDMLLLGGGNPAAIPEVQKIWREEMTALLTNGDEFDKALANYDPPQGNPQFLESFAQMFAQRFSWSITAENVAVSNGAQTGMFCLLNMLGGKDEQGNENKILLPLAPDYIGYADMGVSSDLFISCPGIITAPCENQPHIFKYAVDFAAVEYALKTNHVAAMLVSRPTNPSGNVISKAELERLDALALQYGTMLIIDNAYGVPFPDALEEIEEPFYSPRAIETFSLSKIGLPGLRTAFIVGPPELIKAVAGVTAIVGLANGNIGQRLTARLFQSGRILKISQKIVQPYYCRRRRAATEILSDYLTQAGANWQMHLPQGAFFLWLRLPGLKITSAELYQRLKQRGVLIIPGEKFFYGRYIGNASEDFIEHQTQCLRISFTADERALEQGLKIIAEECYANQVH